jgi:hypothetical protein
MWLDRCNLVLNLLDGLEEQRPLSTPEFNFRIIVKRRITNLLHYNRIYWKNRCTIRWVKLGGENTKFFHTAATKSYRRNKIPSLTSNDGIPHNDHDSKAAIIWNTFSKRLGSSDCPIMHFSLGDLINRVDGMDSLSRPFNTEDIDNIVKSLPIDCALGPDGFNGLFIKRCWHIIKEDFHALCHAFFNGTVNLQSINNSFITLIPEVSSPENLSDYRPISLLNSCLKLLTKLLAVRLQKVILKIVHPNQYGFIRSRTIQDCLAWSFEFLHLCHQSKREIIILKLDFAKAFDMIEHEAVLSMLKHYGANDRFLGWIRAILATGTSLVLLNGVPGKTFHCRRGLRQGDPLSPLLYVSMADLLQTVINRACEFNLLHHPIPSATGTSQLFSTQMIPC